MSSAADPATLLVLSRLIWKFTFLCSIRSHLYQFIWNKILEGFFLVWNCVFVSFYCGTMFLFLYTEELCFKFKFGTFLHLHTNSFNQNSGFPVSNSCPTNISDLPSHLRRISCITYLVIFIIMLSVTYHALPESFMT